MIGKLKRIMPPAQILWLLFPKLTPQQQDSVNTHTGTRELTPQQH
jgi:hypothetical protein